MAKRRIEGIGNNKQIKEQRRKPIPLMKLPSCYKCKNEASHVHEGAYLCNYHYAERVEWL